MLAGESTIDAIEILGERICQVLDEIDRELAQRTLFHPERGADVDCPHEPRNNDLRFLSLDLHFCKHCSLAFRYHLAEADDFQQVRILVAG